MNAVLDRNLLERIGDDKTIVRDENLTREYAADA